MRSPASICPLSSKCQLSPRMNLSGKVISLPNETRWDTFCRVDLLSRGLVNLPRGHCGRSRCSTALVENDGLKTYRNALVTVVERKQIPVHGRDAKGRNGPPDPFSAIRSIVVWRRRRPSSHYKTSSSDPASNTVRVASFFAPQTNAFFGASRYIWRDLSGVPRLA